MSDSASRSSNCRQSPAASGFGADTELGAHATRLYADYAEQAGLGDKDFSGIINMIREKSG